MVTAVSGLNVLGLDWLHSAKSGLFAGIAEDAAYLTESIAVQRTGPQLRDDAGQARLMPEAVNRSSLRSTPRTGFKAPQAN